LSKHDPEARRLSAIMFTDIVGYTALMGRDEAVGRRVQDHHEAVVGPLVTRYQGEWLEERGDETLSVFGNVRDAVNCALAIQHALRDDPELKLRIGVHLGDVTFERSHVIGDGVNVASRIRALAEPGGTCISGEVWQSVKNQSNVETTPLGERELKNVDQPVTVYAVSGTAAEPSTPPKSARVQTRPSRMGRWAAVALGVVVIAGLAWLWSRNQTAEMAPIHSLAVLPFVNMSGDPEQEYFADGIAEELLNSLVRLKGLRVAGRTSSFSFKNNPNADLKMIGEALGVDAILEGSVRKAGNRVRITAQLVNTEDGFHRWSETYDRELTDIFAIQTEIATAIAEALRVSLSSEEHERLATAPTKNLEAYQAYLLGRQRQEKYTTTSAVEAIGYFQRAVELDPKFALAYAGMTDSYLERFQNSGSPPEEMLAKAQAAAEKALELDDRLAEAHVALGSVKWFRNDLVGAEAAFQHALALNPNSVLANLLYGGVLGGDLARYEEALALRRKAVELDPLSLEAVPRLGEDLSSLGRFDEALAWYERSLEIDPGFSYGHLLIANHHWEVSGRLDEAVAWLAKGMALDPGSPVALAGLGWLFLDLGDPDRAEYWINRSIELAPENFFTNLAMQALALHRGDEVAALEHGRKAFAIWPLDGPVLNLLRDLYVRAGRYIEARALYEEHFPELLSERDPEVNLRNYRAAIDLALILSRTGERERADWLLEHGPAQIQRRPRLGSMGYRIADVQVYALRGEKQKALSALRHAIDEGWRANWWYELQHKPDLESLHDEPEYQAMIAEIEADMATQLARVREMERNGELEPIPEVSAAAH
jgi:TolB-like protein/class 3 adenylate cyclase/Tfp pilus assembly protein PilF